MKEMDFKDRENTKTILSTAIRRQLGRRLLRSSGRRSRCNSAENLSISSCSSFFIVTLCVAFAYRIF